MLNQIIMIGFEETKIYVCRLLIQELIFIIIVQRVINKLQKSLLHTAGILASDNFQHY